jgi:flavin-dependent dehydrogenase
MGNQVSYGIAEELLRLSVKYGEESINADIWLNGTGSLEERSTRRFQTQFNASLFAILCEQLLIDEGVELLYGTTIISVKKTGNRISSIITASKSGIIEYTAKAFIDATGDADLFWYAGTKTQVFKQGNLEAQWYYEIMNGEYYLRTLGSSDIPDKYKSRE